VRLRDGWAFIMGRTRSQTRRGGGKMTATSRAMSVWGPGGSRDKRGAWEETDGPIYGGAVESKTNFVSEGV
jgi:hypothetical protein